MSTINKTTFKVSQMDCPSEEQMIRMKLESNPQIKYLDFDIPNRKLDVYHQGNAQEINVELGALKLGEKLLGTERRKHLLPKTRPNKRRYSGGSCTSILGFSLSK